MKFSDMMGPDEESTEQDAVVATDAGAPTLPPIARTAPPLPETPVRFGGTRSALDEAVAGLTQMPEPAPPAEPPRAFGAPPGVPPVPFAPPVPEVDDEVEAFVDAPEADAVVDAPEADAVVETPDAETTVDVPTGGSIAVEPDAVETPTGGTVAVEPAADVEIETGESPADVPVEASRPMAASAFATMAAPAAPEVAEPVVDAVTDTDDDLPTLHDVMAELGPRAQTFDELTASPAQLDTTSWLEGLGSIDDDLLPR